MLVPTAGPVQYAEHVANYAEADARLIALETAGAGSTPTGTGFRHVTSGIEDAAAKLVETADVTDDAVTYAKLQNVSATDKLLGRSTAGAGNVEEIPCTAAGRALLDDVDNAAQRTTLGLGNVDNTSDANKPVSTAQQAAIDAARAGLSIKDPVRAATTANITLSGTQTIDGVSVIAGDRVLVKDQSTGSQNGIYVCAAGAWSRSTDADTSAEMVPGTAVWVNEGTANGDKRFALTTNAPITLNTTSLTFAQDAATTSDGSQSANTVKAGPTSGGAATAAYRALVAADLPTEAARRDAANTFTHQTKFTAISPASFSTNQNDFDPGNATYLRLTATSAAQISGFSGGADGRVLIVQAVAGSNAITLVHQSASSSAANRLTTWDGKNVVLRSNQSLILIYDPAISGTWLVLAPYEPPHEILEYAISDESTAITTGTNKLTVRAPFAFTLVGVRASLGAASSSGIPTFDINEAGTSLLSTKLTIDANEKTSTTAATPAVISDSSVADDAELTFDVDVAGTGAKGAKIRLYVVRT